MADQTDGGETPNQTMFERWQDEQRNWQRLIMEYVDKASTDEAFLTNLGNAMRGSLLVNKPYPGTAVGPGKADDEVERGALDEVVFAVRRLEGQLLDLTMTVENLVTLAASSSSRKSSEPADNNSAQKNAAAKKTAPAKKTAATKKTAKKVTAKNTNANDTTSVQ